MVMFVAVFINGHSLMKVNIFPSNLTAFRKEETTLALCRLTHFVLLSFLYLVFVPWIPHCLHNCILCYPCITLLSVYPSCLFLCPSVFLSVLILWLAFSIFHPLLPPTPPLHFSAFSFFFIPFPPHAHWVFVQTACFSHLMLC